MRGNLRLAFPAVSTTQSKTPAGVGTSTISRARGGQDACKTCAGMVYTGCANNKRLCKIGSQRSPALVPVGQQPLKGNNLLRKNRMKSVERGLNISSGSERSPALVTVERPGDISPMLSTFAGALLPRLNLTAPGKDFASARSARWLFPVFSTVHIQRSLALACVERACDISSTL